MTKYEVVDADGHVLEPPDLWERYIDPRFKAAAPAFVVALAFPARAMIGALPRFNTGPVA